MGTSAAGGAVRPFAVGHRDVLRVALPMMAAYLSTSLVGLVAMGVIGQHRERARSRTLRRPR
jgi:multidrug resistance protein, MATE family